MDALKETINTFDKYAEQYEVKYMSYQPYVESWEKLAGLIAEDASILDVACGPGNIAKYLLDDKSGRKVHGTDLSTKMVGLARVNNPDAIFDVMDSKDIIKLDKVFDAIVAGFCIPYLSREEVIKFISDARQLLNTGGIFYISTMEGDYASSGLQTRNNVDWVCTYYYETRWLVGSLEAAGFKVVDVEHKAFDRDGEPAAVDIFIYAKAC